MVVRSAWRLLICAALAVPLMVLPGSAAQVSCVPSEATASPTRVVPGQRVNVSSTTWFGICNDTGQRIDVTDRAVVTFVQPGLRVELGRTNSNASGRFSLRVRVPSRASAGPAVLQVRGRGASDDVSLTVTAGTLPHTGSDEAVAVLALLAVGSSLVLRRGTA